MSDRRHHPATAELERRLLGWLDAERKASEEEGVAPAEAALEALFEVLPPPAPASGFADRVMTRLARSGRRAVARPRRWSLAQRRWAAAALVAAASIPTLLPMALADAFSSLGLAGLLARLASAATAAAHWFAEASVVAEKVAGTATVAAQGLESAPAAATALVLLALALIGLSKASAATATPMREGKS